MCLLFLYLLQLNKILSDMPVRPTSGKLLTSFLLHSIDDTECEVDSLPATGDGAFFFFVRSETPQDSLESQLEGMQQLFHAASRPSAIEGIYLEPNEIKEETLCYYERSALGDFEHGDNALFSCDHVYVEAEDKLSVNASAASDEESWSSFLDTPLLIFDDRYDGPGFWNFVDKLIRKRTASFKEQMYKVQMQGLAVPVIEGGADSGYTYDIFYSDTNSCDSSGDPEQRNATKYTIRDVNSLEEVLRKSQAYTHSVEKDVGLSHLVLHMRFSGEGQRKQNICLVRLRRHPVEEDSYRLLSAEVLKLLVEELSLASAEKEEQQDQLFQENGIREAFDCTRLTHIISKVIRKFYKACHSGDVPLFHWLTNLPAGILMRIKKDNETLVCLQMEPADCLQEAADVAVRMQEVNITRFLISGKVNAYRAGDQNHVKDKYTAEDLQEFVDEADDSSLSQRRKKLKVNRLYDMVSNSSRSREASRSNSADDEERLAQLDDDEGNREEEGNEADREEKDRQIIPDRKSRAEGNNNDGANEDVDDEKRNDSLEREQAETGRTSVSTAGSYAESWNTVDMGGSAARRRYRLRRKSRRRLLTPAFSDAPEEEAGQIALVADDFDSTSLRGSRSASVVSNE